MQSINLTHHFLIAMPTMAGTCFSKTLTYICEHNEQGALGVVVNRPTEMTVGALFEQVDIPLEDVGIRLGQRVVVRGVPERLGHARGGTDRCDCSQSGGYTGRDGRGDPARQPDVAGDDARRGSGGT
ncbi:MAG: YqgE/AlgH family protein [Proteobacteria bacterium]|nr:YqgE/AlgH family protein [Pseudomonadota bacterium]